MEDHLVIFRDKKARLIHTYVNLEGHGAKIELEHLMSLVAEFYGSPFSTLTKKGHEAKLKEALDKAIFHVKAQTREVASMNIQHEP